MKNKVQTFRKTFIYLFIFFNCFSLYAQETSKNEVYQYGKKIVDTMTSESMHGRGYVNNGDKIAANYIKTEFQKFGLKSFNNDYYQKFSFPINTFPGNMILEIDGKKFIAGQDYIVKGNSGSLSGTFEIVHFDSTILKKSELKEEFKKINFSNKIILVDKSNLDLKNKEVLDWLGLFISNSFKAKGIIFIENKLIAELSSHPESYLLLEMLRASFIGNEKSITVNIENKYITEYQSQNVIAYVKGSEHPDSFIIFSAHYDHLGQMGKTVYFPGANDNASGCAMLLNLAKQYSILSNGPKYSIAFIAFGAEEVGLLGSKQYTETPLFPLKNIRFLLNMDIMGTGEEGITAVNGTLFKTEFDKLKEINTKNNFIKDVKIRGKAANSDHYFFSEKGVKAFFIYTMGGIKAYHDIYDKAETLPLNKFVDLFKMIISFSNYLQN